MERHKDDSRGIDILVTILSLTYYLNRLLIQAIKEIFLEVSTIHAILIVAL